ncbi:hypothetical protein ACSBR1_008081 [Camellia fascicularis]
MTSLRMFDASLNNLNSSLPKWLFNLSCLISLRLGYNNIQGPIPIGLLNMTSLKDLNFPKNFVESTFPNWWYSFSHLDNIGNLTSLISLDLSSNQLEDRIPRSMEKLCPLKVINLSFNKFKGHDVFKSFSRCMSNGLENVELMGNYLIGQLPNELGQLQKSSLSFSLGELHFWSHSNINRKIIILGRVRFFLQSIEWNTS